MNKFCTLRCVRRVNSARLLSALEIGSKFIYFKFLIAFMCYVQTILYPMFKLFMLANI